MRMTMIEKRKLVDELRNKLKAFEFDPKPGKRTWALRTAKGANKSGQDRAKGRKPSHMATMPMAQRAIVERHEKAICAVLQTLSYAECAHIASRLLFASWRESNRGQVGKSLEIVKRLARLYDDNHPANPTPEIKQQMRLLKNPTDEFLCRCDDLIDQHDLFCERAFKGLSNPWEIPSLD